MDYPQLSSLGNTNSIATNRTAGPLVMKKDQLVYGSIKKLMPGNMAEVQVGQTKFMAKIEVPLKAGDTYYFQVTSVQPELNLKVVSDAISNKVPMTEQVKQLLDAFQLPNTKEMRAIAQLFISERLPMTKQQLVQTAEWLKDISAPLQKSALQAVQQLLDMKLPFQKNVFQSILATQDKTSLSNLVQQLQQVIQEDVHVKPELKTSVMQSIQQLTQPLKQTEAQAVLQTILQSVADEQTPTNTKNELMQLLAKHQLIPEGKSFQQLTSNENLLQSLSGAKSETPTLESLARFLKQPTVEQAIQLLQTLKEMPNVQPNQAQKLEQVVQQIIEQAPGRAAQSTSALQRNLVESVKQQALQVLSTVQPTVDKENNQQNIQQPLLHLLKGMTEQLPTMQQFAPLLDDVLKSPNPEIQQVLTRAENQWMSQVNGKEIEQLIRQLVNDLGLSYEAKLTLDKPSEIVNQLKPQLVALMHDATASQQVKDSAESIVMRMNGHQIISADQGNVGSQTQLIMQMPIEMFGHRMDATLQWNGRMKEDGKIDSDYARILFYLQLETLGETVVDMQVQNKVVSLYMYNNDQSIQPFIDSLQPVLKTGLQTTGYQLSGVFLKPVLQQSGPVNEKVHQRVPEGRFDLSI